MGLNPLHGLCVCGQFDTTATPSIGASLVAAGGRPSRLGHTVSLGRGQGKVRERARPAGNLLRGEESNVLTVIKPINSKIDIANPADLVDAPRLSAPRFRRRLLLRADQVIEQ